MKFSLVEYGIVEKKPEEGGFCWVNVLSYDPSTLGSTSESVDN